MSLAEKPWFRKMLVRLGGKKHLDHFLRASRDLRGAQQAVFERIIAENRDTVFGREHGFASIRTIDDYRKQVSTGDFEAHRPYVERMMKGEADVLFPGRPVIYNTTSGTTSKPKMIPISPKNFELSISAINRLWLYNVVCTNPRVYDGKSLSAVASAEDGRVEDGTPYGSISGLAYQNIPAVLKNTHSAQYPVMCIRDYQKKYYAMMRFALACNITYMICPSPSNATRFNQTVLDHAEQLIRDIRDGTLRPDVAEQIPSEWREAICAGLRPDSGRAAQLERLMSRHGDGLRPKHYWPNLCCVNMWKQGNFRLMLPKLHGFFPEACVIRAFGYQASEARAGLVLENDWEHSVLAAHVYHFEFIEESQRAAQYPRTLCAHEVEQGKRYYLLFSNGSGLYRYDINDLVEIVGFYNRFPLFRFIQKGEGITSLTGEKLAEQQLIQAVTEASGTAQIPVDYYVMTANESTMTYTLFVEFAKVTDSQARNSFMGEVDRLLREYNPEYEIKRGSQRLAMPACVQLPSGAQERLKSELVSRRLTTDGQYKDLLLTRKPVVIEILRAMTESLAAKPNTHAHQ